MGTRTSPVFLLTAATLEFEAVDIGEEDEIFACPCHSGRYNAMGEVLSGPPPRPLDLFQLEIIKDELVVDTSMVTQREGYEPSQAVKV